MATAPAPEADAVLPLLTAPIARPWQRALLLALWLAAAAWLMAHHVMWRDEVRAFSLALSGDSVPAMLRRIHGEGHPALWYLLLRGVHAVIGTREALPATGFAIGAATAALWAWRAPFRPLVIALVLFGGFTLYEYTVSARNYGMAMLLMFTFAAAYPRAKVRGPWLGLLLAILCNTNVPAVMLGGALSLFWAVEITTIQGWRWGPRWRHWAGNMAIAAGGVALCFAVIFPPFNDAATSRMVDHLTPAGLLVAMFNVATPFLALLPSFAWSVPGAMLLLAAMIVGAPAGLIRSPGGLVAGALVLVAMPLFFQLVYTGAYRHQALFIALILTLYWLTAEGGGGRWPARRPLLRPTTLRSIQRLGHGALIALLSTQVAVAAERADAALTGEPESRAADLAALVHRERLERAIIVANPDVELETLPYYLPNPLWLVRERRWGRVVAFTRAAKRNLTLGEMLATARSLRARTGRPVLILLQVRLDPRLPAQTWREGYLGSFSTTPAEVTELLGATSRLARYGPVGSADETYDVYLLR